MNELVGITGSEGVLGKILQKKLKEKRIPYSCFKGDIRSNEDLRKWITPENFSSLIHLAAIVPIKEVENNISLAEEVNINGTKNLVKILISQNKFPWLFYASSSHVYQSKNSPIREEDPIKPITEYGRTKLEGEKTISSIYPSYCIGRIFSFYHISQKEPFLYPTILRRLKEEDLSKPFKLFGADNIRDFLNAEDVVDIILKLMENKAKGIYNIGSGRGVSIKEFVQNLSTVPLKIESEGNKMDYLVADINKINIYQKNLT